MGLAIYKNNKTKEDYVVEGKVENRNNDALANEMILYRKMHSHKKLYVRDKAEFEEKFTRICK